MRPLLRMAAPALFGLLAPLTTHSAPPTHAWSHAYGDDVSQYALGIDLDPSGNVLLAATFYGSITMVSPWSSLGAKDILVAKMSSNGTVLWSRKLGSPWPDTGFDVASDALGNVIAVGVLAKSEEDRDAVVLKYTSDGTPVWTKEFASAGNELSQGAEAVAIGPANSVYVAGYFEGTVAFAGGPSLVASDRDLYLVRLDANGNHVWSRRFDAGIEGYIYGLGTDALGNVVFCGGYYGSINLGEGAYNDAGNGDLFLAKYAAANGSPIWTRHYGDDQYQGEAEMAVGANGHIAVAGFNEGTIDFGGGGVTTSGGGDIFVAEISPWGNEVWARGFGSVDYDIITGIAVATDGDVLAAGYSYGDIDFGDGSITPNGDGDYAAFLTRFRDNGDLRWSMRVGDSDRVIPRVMERGNAIYLTGSMEQDTNFGGGELALQGELDLFVARYDQALATAGGDTPVRATLAQNLPNPFNPATTIGYTLEAPADVRIGIYDASGARVRMLDEGAREPGAHSVRWDGTNDSGRAVASGVYFYRLEGAPGLPARKMTLLK